jgi:hypothetical protein
MKLCCFFYTTIPVTLLRLSVTTTLLFDHFISVSLHLSTLRVVSNWPITGQAILLSRSALKHLKV